MLRCEIRNVSQRVFELRSSKSGHIRLKPGESGIAVLSQATVDDALAGGMVEVNVLEEVEDDQ